MCGQYLQHDLKIVRKKKKEAIKGLEVLEADEERILKRMKEHNIRPEINKY